MTYSVLRERYGLNHNVVAKKGKKGKKGKAPAPKKQRASSYSDSDDSNSEDAFTVYRDGYCSDDSIMAEKKVTMR